MCYTIELGDDHGRGRSIYDLAGWRAPCSIDGRSRHSDMRWTDGVLVGTLQMGCDAGVWLLPLERDIRARAGANWLD